MYEVCTARIVHHIDSFMGKRILLYGVSVLRKVRHTTSIWAFPGIPALGSKGICERDQEEGKTHYLSHACIYKYIRGNKVP